MGRESKNVQIGKQRADRKREVKDIQLNVLGVPKTNVNVNKTKQVQEDYHMYKISIDTSKKDKGKKSQSGSLESSTAKTTRENRPKGYRKVSQFSDSSDDEELSYRKDKSPKNLRKELPPDRQVKKTVDVDNEICFTIPGETSKPIKIVGSPTRERYESLESEKPKKSKKIRSPRQVGFSNYDEVYGTSPENSSDESDDTLPYKRNSPQIYKVENAYKPETVFRAPQENNNIESPDNNNLERESPSTKENPQFSGYKPQPLQDKQFITNSTKTPNEVLKPSLGERKGIYEDDGKSKEKSQTLQTEPSFHYMENVSIGSKGKYPFYPYTKGKSSGSQGKPELLGLNNKEMHVTKDKREPVQSEHRAFEKLPSIPEVHSFAEQDKGFQSRPLEQQLQNEKSAKLVPQIIKNSKKDSSTSPMTNDLQKPYISVKQPTSSYSNKLSNDRSSARLPSSSNIVGTSSPIRSQDSPSPQDNGLPKPSKIQDPLLTAKPVPIKPILAPDKKPFTSDAAISPMSSLLNKGRPAESQLPSTTQHQMIPTAPNPTEQIAKKQQGTLLKQDSLPAESYDADYNPSQKVTDPSTKQLKPSETSSKYSNKTPSKVSREVMTEKSISSKIKEGGENVDSKIAKTTSPLAKGSVENKASLSKEIAKENENKPIKSKMAAFVSSIPKPSFKGHKSPTLVEKKTVDNNTETSPIPSTKEPFETNQSPKSLANDKVPVNETVTKSENKPVIKAYPLWSPSTSESHPGSDQRQIPSKKPEDDPRKVESPAKPTQYLPTGIRDSPSIEISNNHYDGHSSGENLNDHPNSGVPFKTTHINNLGSIDVSNQNRYNQSDVYDDSEYVRDGGVNNYPHNHNTNRDILAYPGQMNGKSPFTRDPYKENEDLMRTLQETYKNKIKPDKESKIDPNFHHLDQTTVGTNGEKSKKKLLGVDEPVDTNTGQIKAKIPISHDPYKENDDLIKALQGAYEHGNKDTHSSPNRKTGQNPDKFTQEHMVYLGNMPDTTYDVFYSANASNKPKSGKKEGVGASSGLTGPKGILIFVNKKTDNKSPIDGLVSNKPHQGNTTGPQQGTSYRGSKDAGKTGPYKAKPTRNRTGDSRGTERSLDTNASHPSDRRRNQASKSPDRSKATTSSNARGQGGQSGRHSNDAGRSKYTKGQGGRSGRHSYDSSKDAGRSKQTKGQGERSKDADRSKHTGGVFFDHDSQRSGISSAAGGDKRIKIERSPSGTKITETYSCGCIRVITSDPKNEITREEITSAYCNLGSQCEVSHPELLKSRRFIPVEDRDGDSRGKSPGRGLFPELEIVADGIISRKPIKPKSPLATMKGAKLTGSLNINSNKVKGVCHFYLDPQLKKYLRNNMDTLQVFLEDD